MKIKSDCWDSGNYLTRFYEEKVICESCSGVGTIDDEVCSNCEGCGEWYEYH